MQHVNIKLFAEPNTAVSLPSAIPVFHRWIQHGSLNELLIDVADYSHVPGGPGVVLVGHEAIYSLDNTRNRLGLLYNRRTASDATPREVLEQAYQSARRVSARLETEPEFQGQLRFDPNEVELTLNDRLLHPNTEESWERIRPDVTSFFDAVFGAGAYTLSRAADPRERLRINARIRHTPALRPRTAP